MVMKDMNTCILLGKAVARAYKAMKRPICSTMTCRSDKGKPKDVQCTKHRKDAKIPQKDIKTTIPEQFKGEI
jgi:hypothetical protein